MLVYSYRNFSNQKNQNQSQFLGLLLIDQIVSVTKSRTLAKTLLLIGLTTGLLLGVQAFTQILTLNVESSNTSLLEVRAISYFNRQTKTSNNNLIEIKSETDRQNIQASKDTKKVEAEPKTITYTVKPGDNLYAIAQSYNLDFMDIARDNNLERPFTLQIGQQLYLRLKMSNQYLLFLITFLVPHSYVKILMLN